MKQLNWYDEANSDDSMTLGGVRITPETWVGGVVEFVRYATVTECDIPSYKPDQRDLTLSSQNMYQGYPDDVEHKRVEPIYPPCNFGGLSELRIWRQIAGFHMNDPWPHIEHLKPTKMYHWCIELVGGVCVDQDGRPYIDIPDDELSIDITPELITALQNAQVLAARIKAGRDD